MIESEGNDAEEVDRRIAADHAREEELGLKFGRQAPERKPAQDGDPGFDESDPERVHTTEENAA